jgi:membrane protease YdiL (CAAX protease family)
MPLDQLLTITNLAIIALSLAVFGYMAIRGAFSERQLRLHPLRDLNQPTWVYVIAIMGVLLYSVLKLTVHGEQPAELLLLVELIPFVLAGLLIGRAMHCEAGFRKIGLLPRWPWRDTVWGLVGGLIGLGLAGCIGMAVGALSELIGQPVDPIGHEALKTLRDEFSVELLIGLIISAVIFAPLFEEIVFRGVFQTSLLRLFKGRRWLALLIASAVFSVIHASVVPWQGLVSLFVLGLVFGYLYERTGSLLTPMLAHAVFNSANITIALLLPQ